MTGTIHEAGGCAPPVHSAELPLVDFLRDMARNTANIDRRVAHRLNEAADALARQGGAPALEQIKALLDKLPNIAILDAVDDTALTGNRPLPVTLTLAEWRMLRTALQALRDEAGEAVELHSVVTKFKPTGVLMSVADVMNLLGLVADDDPSLPPHLRCGPEFVREAARCGIEALRALTRPAPAAEAAPQGAYEGVGCVFCDLNAEHWGELCTAATPPSAPAVADAEAMGASGGPANELERLAFEAWMRGHCWALSATWNGTEYRSDAEQCGRCCPQAATTRMLWAAWRDRAALSAPVPQEGVDEAMEERALRAFWQAYGDQQRLGGGRQAGRTAAGIRAVLALAAGALPQVDASWLADVRRCLEDVSTEMRSRGRGDERFQRLIQRMPRLAAAPAQGVR